MRAAEQARQIEERARLMQPRKIVAQTVELKEGNSVTYSLAVNSNFPLPRPPIWRLFHVKPRWLLVAPRGKLTGGARVRRLASWKCISVLKSRKS